MDRTIRRLSETEPLQGTVLDLGKRALGHAEEACRFQTRVLLSHPQHLALPLTKQMERCVGWKLDQLGLRHACKNLHRACHAWGVCQPFRPVAGVLYYRGVVLKFKNH